MTNEKCLCIFRGNQFFVTNEWSMNFFWWLLLKQICCKKFFLQNIFLHTSELSLLHIDFEFVFLSKRKFEFSKLLQKCLLYKWFNTHFVLHSSLLLNCFPFKLQTQYFSIKTTDLYNFHIVNRWHKVVVSSDYHQWIQSDISNINLLVITS